MSRAAIKDGVSFRLADSEYESSVVNYYGESCIQVRYDYLHLCKDCAEELYEMNKKFMEKKGEVEG